MRQAKRGFRQWMAAVLAAMAFGAQASAPDLQACLEGGDFIGNAARGRDNGAARDAFLERMEADFAAIRAYPPQLRWFAQDAEDERFLLASAAEVFDRPDDPEAHRTRFVRACLGRASA